MNASATFAPMTRATRVRTEGQQQRMDRRNAERNRSDARKMDRNTKRSQAFA